MDELSRLLKVAYLVMDDGDRRAVLGADLTLTQYHLLRTVDEDEGDPSVTELASHLLCTRGNVTRLVARMVSQSLVTTVSDHRDQRLVRVRLTDQGRERLARARGLLAEAQRRRFAGMDEAQVAAAVSVLENLAERLQADLDRQESQA